MSSAKGRLAVSAVVILVAFLPVTAVSVGTVATPAISVGQSATDSPGESITVEPGETTTVTVWANVSAVSGYQTNLTFDPAVVRIDDVSGGADFDDPVANVNNDAGWVAFNQLRSSDTDDPVVAEITLTVTGQAGEETALSFVQSETKFVTSDGETFTPETHRDVTVRVEDEETPTPTSTETTEQPTSTETTEQPTSTETTEQPTSTETTEQPTSTETTEQPTSTETQTDDGDSDDGSSGVSGEDEEPAGTTTEAPVNGGGGSSGGSSGGGSSGGSSGGGSSSSDSSGGGGDSDDTDSENSVPSEEPLLTITETQLNTSSQVVDRPVLVSATFENTDDVSREIDARLYVDGNESDKSQAVQIDTGEQRTVNFSVRFDSPGTYAVGVNETAVGNVTVTEANASNATATPTATERAATTTPTSTPEPTTTDATAGTTATPDSPASETDPGPSGMTSSSSPGFGLVITLVTMGLLVVWLGRRERSSR